MVPLEAQIIARGPGLIGRALGRSDQDRDPQTLHLAHQLAGAKCIEIGLEAPSIQTPHHLEATLFLSPQFEDVAEKSDA